MNAAPPHDLAAEQAVLGGMLLSADADADAALDPADFYRPAHALVFEAAAGLRSRGEPADAVTVVDELTRRGQLEKAGGAAYLHTLLTAVPTAASTGYYARIVADKARLRRLAEAAEQLARLASAPGADPDAVAQAARDLAAAGTRSAAGSGWPTPAPSPTHATAGPPCARQPAARRSPRRGPGGARRWPPTAPASPAQAKSNSIFMARLPAALGRS